MPILRVKPGAEYDAGDYVAFVETDPIHAQADAKWDGYNGVFIAGDHRKPGQEYLVLDTPAVRQAIRDGKLVLLEDTTPPAEPEPVVETKATKSKG